MIVSVAFLLNHRIRFGVAFVVILSIFLFYLSVNNRHCRVSLCLHFVSLLSLNLAAILFHLLVVRFTCFAQLRLWMLLFASSILIRFVFIWILLKFYLKWVYGDSYVCLYRAARTKSAIERIEDLHTSVIMWKLLFSLIFPSRIRSFRCSSDFLRLIWDLLGINYTHITICQIKIGQ